MPGVLLLKAASTYVSRSRVSAKEVIKEPLKSKISLKQVMLKSDGVNDYSLMRKATLVTAFAFRKTRFDDSKGKKRGESKEWLFWYNKHSYLAITGNDIHGYEGVNRFTQSQVFTKCILGG